MEGINHKTVREVLQMKWLAQHIDGEKWSDYFDRMENGVMTWKKRRNFGTVEMEIKGIEKVPEWATKITTYKMEVVQYAGTHPEKGLKIVVL